MEPFNRHILLVLLTCCTFSVGSAQVFCESPGMYCMQSGTIQTCAGTLITNQNMDILFPGNDTITFVPAVNGNQIILTTGSISLTTGSSLKVFDGPDVNAPLLGQYLNLSASNLVILPSLSNTSGELTVVYIGTSTHFTMNIDCAQPCLAGSAVLTVSGNNNMDGGFYQFCLGNEITLSAEGSIPPDGYENIEYRWHINSNIYSTTEPSYSLIMSEQGIFELKVEVISTTYCSASSDSTHAAVNSPPTFQSNSDFTFCIGAEYQLNGSALSSVVSNSFPIILEATTYLSDGVGFSYQSPINVTGFPADATVANCSDFESVMVNMEHSFMGDLNIALTCPNGTTVNLVQWGSNGGGGTFLGLPVDDETTNPGIGYDYFWTPGATNGTWGQNSASGPSLPSGTYQSAEDLCMLQSCPVNGEWTLTVTDNLAIDNGYVFNWGMHFSGALIPELLEYTQTFGIDADSTYWTGEGLTFIDANLDNALINTNIPANFAFTYHAIGSSGCEYANTIEVDVIENTLMVDAGIDFSYGPTTNQLSATINLEMLPCYGSVSTTYCYPNNANQTFSFNSLDISGCSTPLSIAFDAGTLGEGDFLIIYQGTAANPWSLITQLTGDLVGQTFHTSSTNNVISIHIISDSSNSCASLQNPEVTFRVFTQMSHLIDVQWTPTTGLANPNALTTLITNPLIAAETYSVTVTPNNSIGCDVVDSVHVIFPVYFLSGVTYYDANQNGIFDVTESIIPYFPIALNAGQYTVYSNANGEYLAYALNGSNTVSVGVDPFLWLMTTPSTYTFELSTTTSQMTDVNFGVIASANQVVAVDVQSTYNTGVCNSIDAHFVTITNDGNVPATGYVTYTLPSIVPFTSTTPTADNVIGNTLYFQYNNLPLNSQFTFVVYVQLPGVAFLNQSLTFISEVYALENGTTSLQDTCAISFPLACAYDPNYITENTGFGDEGWITPNTNLEYTIHFQNIGNAPATDVVIIDSLDSHLIWSSLDPIAWSDNFELMMNSEGILTFTFPDINLPGVETDEPNSHGFITYKIAQQHDLTPGTIIHNQASIIFDLNDPIITNQTVNTIILCNAISASVSFQNGVLFSTPATGNTQWFNENGIIAGAIGPDHVPLEEGNYFARINIGANCQLETESVLINSVRENTLTTSVNLFPNPVNDELNWNANEPICEVQILTMQGKLIESSKQNNNVSTGKYDTSVLPTGVYFVRFRLSTGEWINKKLSVLH